MIFDEQPKLLRVYHDGKYRFYNHHEQVVHEVTDIKANEIYTPLLSTYDCWKFVHELGFTGVEGIMVFHQSGIYSTQRCIKKI